MADGGATTPLDAATVWQVKASTLCNLRCRYCYEWDRLADARRLPMALWRRAFEAMRDYRAHRQTAHGLATRIQITWHGGEPLALPAGYVRDVLALQAEVLGPADGHMLVNLVQTNLFRLNETLRIMLDAGFALNVSWDGAEGVRLDGAGRDSNADVLANIRALSGQGHEMGISVVLGRHNAEHLSGIHDQVAALGVDWLRINPMFAPPKTAPAEGLALSIDEIQAALRNLIDHRAVTGSTLEVAPLDRAARTVRRWQAGRQAMLHDRSGFGETRLVVHPDGKLAIQPGPTLPDRLIGDLATHSMAEILTSPAYLSTLAEDRAKRARHCGTCAWQQACTGLPLIETPLDNHTGPCAIEPGLCAALAGSERFRSRQK